MFLHSEQDSQSSTAGEKWEVRSVDWTDGTICWCNSVPQSAGTRRENKNTHTNMKRDRKTRDRREIINYEQQISASSYPTITSYRAQPKSLPPLSPSRPLSYSETLKVGSYRNTNKAPSRQESSRKNSIKSTRERFKDENVVVVRDNVRESQLAGAHNPSPDNLNPFHHDFNKVIDNPFLLSQAPIQAIRCCAWMYLIL